MAEQLLEIGLWYNGTKLLCSGVARTTLSVIARSDPYYGYHYTPR
jgi:hypothetical protein